MGVYIFNLASVVVCVLFDLYGGDNVFHAYISFFIVDLPTRNSRKLSDTAYLLAVSILFAVCSGTSMRYELDQNKIMFRSLYILYSLPSNPTANWLG